MKTKQPLQSQFIETWIKVNLSICDTRKDFYTMF